MATRKETIKRNIIVSPLALFVRAPLKVVGMALVGLGKFCETLAEHVPGMDYLPLTEEKLAANRKAAMSQYLRRLSLTNANSVERTNAKIDALHK